MEKIGSKPTKKEKASAAVSVKQAREGKDTPSTFPRSAFCSSFTFLRHEYNIIYHNAVGEVGGHDEIVLHHESRFLGVHDEPLDDFGASNALLTVLHSPRWCFARRKS